jgi:uncharacterized protein YndB with AHSA1/START domain
METTTAFQKITIGATVNAPVEKVWQYWGAPEHITKWNSPSPDWHTPYAENDLRTGGKFVSRMEAKDGSFGFDFGGVYDEVIPNKRIVYTMGDGRQAVNDFISEGDQTRIVIVFDAEHENPIEFQQAGWQAILDSFKKYTEEN